MDEFLKQGGSDAEQLIRITKIHWSCCLSHWFNTYWALTKPTFLWDLLGKRVLPQGRVFLGSLGVLHLKPVEPFSRAPNNDDDDDDASVYLLSDYYMPFAVASQSSTLRQVLFVS